MISIGSTAEAESGEPLIGCADSPSESLLCSHAEMRDSAEDEVMESVAVSFDCERPEGLPPEAPCHGVVITVDTTRNILRLFRDGELVREALAATGSNQWLVKGSRKWLFRTPHGRMPVLDKKVNPVWVKPDWAFVEAGKPVPPGDSPSRKEAGVLGRYALDLGEGIMIHGTKELDSLGKNASHGCIRLGDEMLELVFNTASIGTPVYVF